MAGATYSGLDIKAQPKKEAKSLGKALDKSLLNLPLQLNTSVKKGYTTGTGIGVQSVAPQTVVSDEYEKYRIKDQGFQAGKSGAKSKDLGYAIPVKGAKFKGSDIVAQYDSSGKFLYYTTPPTKNIQLGNDLQVRPKINANGDLIEYKPFKPSTGGGFFEDVGPLILTGVGANLFSGANLLGGTAGTTGALTEAAGTTGALTEAGTAGSVATEGSGLLGGGSTALTGGTAVDTGALGALGGAETTAATTTGATTGAGTVGGNIAESGGLLGGGSTALTGGTAMDAGTVTASSIGEMSSGSKIADYLSQITGIPSDTIKSYAPSAIQGLLSAGGSYLTSESAKESSQNVANAITDAAKISAESAKFKPVGVTTRFGTSKFTYDKNGNITGAGYTASPEITGYQDKLTSLAGTALTDVQGARAAYQPLTSGAQSLFTLGKSYLAKSPEDVAADYIKKQQALLAPTQETQLAQLQDRLQAQGRGGLSVAQGGTLGATSPELQAYYNSLAQSNLYLSAQADQEAQNRIKFGAGLFDTGAGLQNKYYAGQTAAYSPFTTAMDVSSGLESLAQQPLNLSTSIGSKVSTANANAGAITGQGIINAATTMAPSNAYSFGGNVLSGVASSPAVSNALNKSFGNTPQTSQQQYVYNSQTGQYVPVSSTSWS